jgi:hypothetical protein
MLSVVLALGALSMPESTGYLLRSGVLSLIVLVIWVMIG